MLFALNGIMENDSHKMTKRGKAEAGEFRSSFVFTSPLFGGKLSKNSYRTIQVELLIRLLQASGLRISEALRLESSAFVDIGRLAVQTHKRGNMREFNIPIGLYYSLLSIVNENGKCFSLTYNYVYKAVKRMNFKGHFIKNNVNFSITHFFRKQLIRRMFYDYKNPVDFILNFFGWKSKKSLLYYL